MAIAFRAGLSNCFGNSERLTMPAIMENPPSSASSKKRTVLLIIGVPLLLLGLALGYARWFLVLHTRQLSSSMEPTYPAGREVAYQPLFGGGHVFNRGQIVLMVAGENAKELPKEAVETILMRRIVGLPGETVRIDDMRIEIDGRAIPWKDLGSIDGSRVTPSGPFTVPPGHYFMIGDNLKDALDSRIEGSYPASSIIGVVRH